MDLNLLNTAKEDSNASREKSYADFDKLVDDAKSTLMIFASSEISNSNLLRKAADMLVKALELRKNKAEPYYYLAYIFYLREEFETAIKYLKIVEELDLNYPNISELKESITESISKIS